MTDAMYKREKPLGGPTYGHIGHLPGSRRGPGDHGVNDGMARIVTEKTKHKDHVVIVQEKLDGSCMSVARHKGEILPLMRAGYPAWSSKYEQHHMFAKWVTKNLPAFDFLEEGERVVGEWLAQAHGTRYNLEGLPPFVPFDIMKGHGRLCAAAFYERLESTGLHPVGCISIGPPMAIEIAIASLGQHGFYQAIDQVEGVVYRCERAGKVEFLAKWVRPDKVDGCYLPEVYGKDAVWNYKE